MVDNIGDTDDGDYSSGQNTLREVIANASAGNTITFDPSIAGQTITLTSVTQLTIDKNLTIDGSGQNITISGANAVRVFEVTTGTVTFTDLTIDNGRDTTPNGTGGLYINTGAIVTINKNTFTNHTTTANESGPALHNNGTVTINNSTFSNNSAPTGAGTSGAIFNDGGTITANNSTFVNNSSIGAAGALRDEGGVAILNNSTFYGNSSSDGGAIRTTNGTVTVRNCTLSNNSASNIGGGILNSTGTLHLLNTIIGNSTNGDDCVNNGSIVTDTNNLIETGSCGTPASTADPMLSALADNGGYTQTMALQAGSPAINAGDNATCEATDQRGATRLKTVADPCDIGAYEVAAPVAPSGLSATAVSQTQIDLAWTDESAIETGFNVERDSTSITTTAADATTYSDSGLSCGITYSYSLKATGDEGDSSVISDSATTSACPPPVVTPPLPTITYELKVNKIGNGSLAVNNTTCSNNGSQCTRYVGKETLVITATPDSGWAFAGFTGDCNSATVFMDEDKSCTAIFQQQHTLTIKVNGQGAVNECGSSCSFPKDDTVSLTTSAPAGWALSEFGGDCSKTGTVMMDSDKYCTATFIKGRQLTINLVGKGTVTGKGIECPKVNCSAAYSEDSIVTLAAEADPEWFWQGFSGDCNSEGIVNIDANKTCTATFTEDTNIPNGGDGNGDGIKDTEQAHVVSMRDIVDGEYFTIVVDEGVNITNVYTDQAENEGFSDDSVFFPQGIVYFEIEGTATDVTIYYHGLEYIFRPSFMKFGATTPGDLSTIDWYTMPNVTFGTANLNGKTVVTAKYHLKDGELGDNTGVDERIVDPGGIALKNTP